jgi:hypothetical protein
MTNVLHEKILHTYLKLVILAHSLLQEVPKLRVEFFFKLLSVFLLHILQKPDHFTCQNITNLSNERCVLRLLS